MRLFDFPNCNGDKYPIEKYKFDKVLNSLIECSLIAERFYVKIQFLASGRNFAIQVYLKIVCFLPTLTYETMHKYESMSKHSL